MDREILFRGKVTEDCRDEKLRGQWIEGSLIHQLWYYGSRVDRYHILYDGEFDCDYYMAEVVIPETVGQFTGLTDKNGKKIFEGDIVKCSIMYDIGCYPHSETEIRVVKYIDGYFYPLRDCERNTCEVIGNVHDNPELLTA